VSKGGAKPAPQPKPAPQAKPEQGGNGFGPRGPANDDFPGGG
jgi:hypothetical protein